VVKTMPYDKVLQENIEFSELEREIVQLDEFKRLKFVKQNGFSYVSYPYARHSRWDHSIGTMYWATHLYKSIIGRNEPSDDDTLQGIRLAALVHDIGHGPFSHALEMLFDRNPDLLDYEPWKRLSQKFGSRKPHELLTLNFVDSKTFRKLIPCKIRRYVSETLNKKSWLSLLISGDLDADRLDYLTRDSHHSGLPFGLNVKPIFNELIQGNLQTTQIGSKYFLQIDSKGVPAFEQLLMARYAHYCYLVYKPTIQLANLAFISSLEESLWQRIKQVDKIALATFYIFTELTDDKLLDLDFSDVKEGKKKLLDKIKTTSITKTFDNLKRGNTTLNSKFIRLSCLGKKSTFNFLKIKNEKVKKIEARISKCVKQPVKMHLCLPETLTTRTCVDDRDIKSKYNPSLVYDYSPVIRALEQKMYLDCGIVVSSAKDIPREKLVSIFDRINGGKTDFDVCTYATLEYIDKVKQSFAKKDQIWRLRRNSIFGFLRKLLGSFWNKGLIKNRVEFITPWYSEKVYELLQKLEFLDAIGEDFNISIGNGFIPCYVYSIGEYGEEVSKFLVLTPEARCEIQRFVEKYIKAEEWRRRLKRRENLDKTN